MGIMKKKKKVLLCMMGILVLLAIGAYLAVAIYFKNHFYSQTTVNGVDASRLTAQEVAQKLRKQVAAYTLRLVFADGSAQTLTAEELQLSYIDNGEIEKRLQEQESWLWALKAFQEKDHQLEVPVEFSEEAAAAAVDGLEAMQAESTTPPQDAYIAFGDEGYKIVPETEGNRLNREKVLEAVGAAVLEGAEELDLYEGGCYDRPAVYRDDAALLQRQERLNQLVAADLTMDFGSGRTERVDRNLLSQWVVQDDSGNDSIDGGQVTAYVQELAAKYNTAGTKRSFQKTGGGTAELSLGDYGWVMDEETTAAQLMEAIGEGRQGAFEVTYSSTAKSRGKNDIGDSYIELSIDQQKLWCYVDGKLVVETPVVTGCVEKGTETPRGGVWKIKSKKSPYTMYGKKDENGEYSYIEEVNYWIPYTEDFTIGLHDLTSRSAFGGDIYLTNGSHGCVNTPLEAMKQIYDVVAYGFPVVVY